MCFRAIKKFGFLYLNADDNSLCNDNLSNVLEFAGNPIFFGFFCFNMKVLCHVNSLLHSQLLLVMDFCCWDFF